MKIYPVLFIAVSVGIYLGNPANVSSINQPASTFTSCNGKITVPGTIITSENYPEQYLNNQDCYLDIEFEAGNQVELTFLDFDVVGKANKYNSGCSTSNDYLELIDGFLSIGRPYCKFNQPIP